MSELKQLIAEYEKHLNEIKELGDVGNSTIGMVLQLLGAFEKSPGVILGAHAADKLGVVKEQISKFKNHELLKNKYRIMYSQSLVLVVSAFESFMNDLFKIIINNYPELMNWPSKKTMSIDVSLLNFTYPTVGDLVLKSFRDEINFQNFDNTMAFCNIYLKLDIKFKKASAVKFFQNLRHIVVHNSSRVDATFLKVAGEVGRTVPKNDEQYNISETEYLEADSVFREFFAQIVTRVETLATSHK